MTIGSCPSPRRIAACALTLCVLVAAARGAGDNVAPEGYTALFNGTDLAGWKGLVADPPARAAMAPARLAEEQGKADERMRAHWRAENGALVFDGKGDSLCTAGDYADFDLYVDWKIEPKGDSGIYLRGSPQVQIWDNPIGSGGLYNNQKNPSGPLFVADRPVGQWNTFRIIMTGERVTVYLNGILVVDDTPFENYWERGKPIYPAGQIELQNHGNTLYFKNIYIRELPAAPARAASSPLLKSGQRVAVAGDSITEQKLYSRFIEDYLLMCRADMNLACMQFGWGGERAPGFHARFANDCLAFKPDVVTTCYGMNDGLYRSYEPGIGGAYGQSMREIVRAVAAAGATMVVGSPGAVDLFTFRWANLPPPVYNDNLAHLRDIARDIAREAGLPFANVHDHMMLAQLRAKPVLGEAYDVCGGDGFHPHPNGHIVMAYAFLKAMGLDGTVGAITVDMQGGATASGGHTVLSAAKGAVELRSVNYPFCFFGDEKSPSATQSILPFVPFNEDLNRLTLVVTNLAGDSAKVTWGAASKVFPRARLEKGINLAAEFLDNPFSEPFRKIDALVAKKQEYETAMIKEAVTRFRWIRTALGDDAEGGKALDALRDKLFARQRALHEEVRAAIAPVTHTLAIGAP
ncbi:MAG TPA: hypothetical protein DCM87_17015 [Planctomycetes bacterium]|nr:hypothetical protein [Planctomycetota bacterium]